MRMVLEWDVQQAHIGVMVRCPLTFGHIVYFVTSYNNGATTFANLTFVIKLSVIGMVVKGNIIVPRHDNGKRDN